MSTPRMLTAAARAARLRPARASIAIPARPISSSVALRSNESHEKPSDIEPTAGPGDSAKGAAQDDHMLNKKHRLDVQSDAAASARSERGQKDGAPDAVKASTEKTNGEVFTKQRDESMGETSKQKLGWQPGQGGDQVGGHGGGQGGTTGQKKAADESLLGKAKAALGMGEGRVFSTLASGLWKEGDSKARKVKDAGVAADQNPHLKHHDASSSGDAAPAVRDSASLPSHGGSQGGSGGPGASKTPKQGSFTGSRHQPSASVDPSESLHAAGTDRPSAAYTHVKGQPEPDSFRGGYETADKASQAIPSGRAKPSSGSTDPYNEHTTRDHPQNPDGIGRSHKVETLDDAVEAMEEGKGKTSQPDHAKGGVGGEQHPGTEDLQYEKSVPPEFNEERAHFRPPLDKKPPK